MLQAKRSRVRFQMRSLKSFSLPYHSSRTMSLGITQPLTEMSTRNYFWGVERGRRVMLKTSPPSVSLLSIQHGVPNNSQPHRPPRPVTGIALHNYYYAETCIWNYVWSNSSLCLAAVSSWWCSINWGSEKNSDDLQTNNKLRGLSQRTNYTDRSIAYWWGRIVPTFADRGCHVDSVMDPNGRIPQFLDRCR
jgi:hypothetical protein